MDKHCMIISGGDFSPIPQPGPDTFVIACDRGYAYAERCGIRPDLLVSDFDSYSGSIDPSIPVHRFRAEKDDTDTMIAIRTAIEQGFTSAELYCALGGRLDHTLANLQSMVFAEKHGLSLRIDRYRIAALEDRIRRAEEKVKILQDRRMARWHSQCREHAKTMWLVKYEYHC